MHGRRDFLKGMAGGMVTGFPLVVPASALGRGAAAAPSDRIVMGAIGVGRQGSGHMRGFLNDPDVRVLAICDVQQANRERSETLVNSRYGSKECVTYNDYREVLERRDIDVVFIATGERWHPLIAVEAANHGKTRVLRKTACAVGSRSQSGPRGRQQKWRGIPVRNPAALEFHVPPGGRTGAERQNRSTGDDHGRHRARSLKPADRNA